MILRELRFDPRRRGGTTRWPTQAPFASRPPARSTRADLADVVHREIGLSRAESAGHRRARARTICAARSSDGENVKISGFGSFILRDKGERVGRNPKTGRRGADRAAPRADLPRQPDHARADRPTPADARWRPAARATWPSGRSASLPRDLGVPQHILRYWETRFPQLKPLQRAGNRRYYRPDDVALAQRIHRLLNQEGYTIRGVQQLLRRRRPRRPARSARRRSRGRRDRRRRPPTSTPPSPPTGCARSASCWPTRSAEES